MLNILVPFKFNDKQDMENYENTVKKVMGENKERWSKLGNLATMEKSRWRILKERTNDIDMLKVLNQTDDIFWFARHTVDDKKSWVESAMAGQKMGAWYGIRWWGLMENVDNPEQVACCLRIPRENLSEVLSKSWEGVGAWRKMMSINIEGNLHLKKWESDRIGAPHGNSD